MTEFEKATQWRDALNAELGGATDALNALTNELVSDQRGSEAHEKRSAALSHSLYKADPVPSPLEYTGDAITVRCDGIGARFLTIMVVLLHP